MPILKILELSLKAHTLDDFLEILVSNLLEVHRIEKVELLLLNKVNHLIPVATAVNTGPQGKERQITIQSWLLNSHVRHTARKFDPPVFKSAVSVPLPAAEGLLGFMNIQFDQMQILEKNFLNLFYLLGLQVAAKIRELMLNNEIGELRHELEAVKSNHIGALKKSTSLSKELYAISAIAIKINQSLNIDDSLKRSMAKVREIFKASGIVAYLKNAETAKPEIAAVDMGECCGDSLFKHFIKIIQKDYLRDIIAFGKPVHKELIPSRETDHADSKEFRCVIGVALRSMRTIIGALFLSLDSLENFGQDNLRLLCGIANVMAMAIENKNLYHQSKMKEKEASFLVHSITKFHEKLDLTQTLTSIAEKGAEFVGEECCVYLFSETKTPMIQSGYSETENRLTSDILQKIEPKELEKFYNIMKLKNSPTHIGSILRLKQIGTDLKNYFKKANVRSLIAVPIKIKEKKLGLLLLCSLSGNKKFGRFDLSFAETLGNAASIAIENAMSYTASLELSDFLEKKITENKEQIQQILERQSIRVENRKDIIFRINRKNRFVFVNRAMETLTGCSREELYQGKFLLDDIVAPEDMERVGESFKKIFSGELPLARGITYRHLNKKGEDRFISMTVYPETDRHGQITGLEGVGEDITEKVRLKTELEKSRNLAMLGEFSAAVAHQIRNPLGNILMGVKLIQKILGLNSDEESALFKPDRESLVKVFSNLSEGIGNLNQIVTELLNYTKTLKLTCSSQKIDIILSDTLMMFQDMILQNGIRVEKRFDPHIPELSIDAVLMGQVFQNVIHNAIQAMPNSGVLSLSAEISDQKSGDVMILISDTGPGIEPSEYETVFRPFYSTKKTGIGLGLSIAHRIVEAHQGSIWVCHRCCHDNRHEGATVHIRLSCNTTS